MSVEIRGRKTYMTWESANNIAKSLLEEAANELVKGNKSKFEEIKNIATEFMAKAAIARAEELMSK